MSSQKKISIAAFKTPKLAAGVSRYAKNLKNAFYSLETKTRTIIILSSVIWLTTVAYMLLAYPHLPTLIPLWHSRAWGTARLATKNQIIVMGIGFASTLVINTAIIFQLNKIRAKLGVGILAATTLLLQITYAWETWFLSSQVVVSEVVPIRIVTQTILPSVIAFSITSLIAPLGIKLAKKHQLVTDPKKDHHPAMLLTKATPRAGAVVVIGGVLATSLLLLPITKNLIGIYLGAIVAAITGLIDDKFDLNPYVRLGVLMPIAALLVVGLGVGIPYINNPFGGQIDLTQIQIHFNLWGPHSILVIATIVSFFWILWVMNMLSWSNGVDGQFPGVVAIAALIIGILSFRLEDTNPEQIQAAILSFALFGALLGIVRYTWHPCKVLLGFGATGIGLILASIAIFSVSKVAAASLILLVPSLDALYVILERLRKGQSPVWGDKGHLHHRLLGLGLSQPQVALVYWSLTALFGGVALATSGHGKFITAVTGLGVILTIVIIWSKRGKLSPTKQGITEAPIPKAIENANGENFGP